MSITLTTRETRPATGLVLLTMSLGVLIAQIDTSVVNLAIKPIGTDFKAGVTALQWIVDAYNLVYASLLATSTTTQCQPTAVPCMCFGTTSLTYGDVRCGVVARRIG